jgi:hypothetical protein
VRQRRFAHPMPFGIEWTHAVQSIVLESLLCRNTHQVTPFRSPRVALSAPELSGQAVSMALVWVVLAKRAFTLVLMFLRSEASRTARQFPDYPRALSFQIDDCLLDLRGEHDVRKLKTLHSDDSIRSQLHAEAISSRAIRSCSCAHTTRNPATVKTNETIPIAVRAQ